MRHRTPKQGPAEATKAGARHAISVPVLSDTETTQLDQRLIEEAQPLRKQAEGARPSFERELLLRKARQAEAAAHMQEWLSSPGLQSPG